MNNDFIKGAFAGMGALLGVLVLGFFVFSYFNSRVLVLDNTSNVINVTSADGSKNLGYVFVDMGKLTSTVEDEEFVKYYDANKFALADAEYTYKTEIINSNNEVEEREVKTVRNNDDFAFGLVEKLTTDLKDKFTFKVETLIIQ